MLSYFKILRSIWIHPANRGQRLGAIARSLYWWLAYRLPQRSVQRQVFGYPVRLDPQGHETRNIVYYTPQAEYDTTRFFQRYLRPGDAVLDIGANIGLYSLLSASLVGERGRVHAFEPCPATFDRLSRTLTDNQLTWVQGHPVALGEQEAILQFTTDLDTVNHVMADAESRSSSMPVACRRLDDVVDVQQQYAIAKLDVEGFELSVLRGASRLLAHQGVDVLIVEINGALYRYGIQADDLVSYLFHLGYDAALYDATAHRFAWILDPCDAWGNVWFISQRHRDRVLARLQLSDRPADPMPVGNVV